jgi:hypothetical protein
MFFKNAMRNVSDMFKKGTQNATELFKKAPAIAQDVFDKGREVAGNVSNYATQAGDILGKVAKIGSSILADDTVRGLAGTNEHTRRAYDIANRGANMAHVGSSLAGQVGRFTDERQYNGSHESNVRDAISKAKKIKDEAQLVRYV